MNVVGSLFSAANDTALTGLPEAVQRAVAAYCAVYKAPVEDVAAVARRCMRRVGSAGAGFEAYSWFQLILDQGPRLRLRVLPGGAQ